jgi:hypothetical protein
MTGFWAAFHKAQHGEFEADLGKPPHTAMLIMPALRIPMGKPSTKSRVGVELQDRLLAAVKTAIKSLFSSGRWRSKYM